MTTALHRDDRQRGFTLIEVLTVTIIVGVLAAIAVPVFLGQRRKAQEATLRADMHNLALAFEAWGVDHPGQIYPDSYYRWANSTQNTVPPELGARVTDGTTFHAFDMAYMFAGLGYQSGQAYCIEMFRHGTNGTIRYYLSSKGGQIPTRCQDAP